MDCREQEYPQPPAVLLLAAMALPLLVLGVMVLTSQRQVVEYEDEHLVEWS